MTRRVTRRVTRLEDIKAQRRWHAESVEQTLDATSFCMAPSGIALPTFRRMTRSGFRQGGFLTCLCFRAWRNLLQDQAWISVSLFQR